MKKKQVFLMIAEAIFFMLIIVFSMYYLNGPGGLVGFTIYESQPGAADGNDTYIWEQTPTSNYGTQTSLIVGKSAAGNEFRSMIYFDLSSVPEGNTITNAILSLNLASSSNSNSITIKVYRLTSSWEEDTSTWTNKTSTETWGSDGGDYSEEEGSAVFSDTTGWYNITITSLVRGWLNSSYSNYGILLLSDDSGNGDFKEIDSSDSTESLAPKIIIDYTENAAPGISEVSTDTSLSSLKHVGENVTFTISWSDLEGNSAKALVCNSSNISLSQGCGEKTFCNTSYSTSSPITCQYTITNSENRTTNFWISVCDSTNCSSSNQSQFYMNHFPNITLIQPNGGEIVNQSLGNYSVKFNVSDADSESLIGDIYYGETQNSTTYQIATNMNLANYCTDADSDTATTNNCTYSWNSLGIYGVYFLTININDSYSSKNDSSDSSFTVSSIVDSDNPNITSQWIESGIYSGKSSQIYANISDANRITAWVSFNYTSSNITMSNTTLATYNATFTAPAVGNYKFKVYARDPIGNLNDSMSWQEFSVTKPSAVTQNNNAPSTALPYHVIKVSGQLNASDSLRDVYAYLNIPEGFTFLSGYSQNSYLGNFTSNETKTATWFLSTSITESTYNLNITYTDDYSNTWNSSNSQIQITSAIGSYLVSVSGYPEVETSGSYYAESSFTQNGATYADPDTITISIYDASGSLTVGPASMTQESTGKYNYSYTVGASAAEGQWETRINATKSSTSYYANQFWKVVGGPFDVRDIVVDDSSVSALQISLTTENTGGANKDLTLVWNLTREDTGAVLDSGSDTFMVSANSEKEWTIYPTISYVGQVRITFLGYYSLTEKAGAYKIFSTTSGGETPITPPSTGGGGGGGATAAAKTTDFTIDAEKSIYLTKNTEKIISIKIENTGETTLNNLTLDLENLEESYYTITPLLINSLKPGKTAEFKINFFVSNFIGEKDFSYKITSNELTKKEEATIIVLSMKDFYLKELERLKEKDLELNQKIPAENTELLASLKTCEQKITEIELNIEKEEFINAKNNIQEADDCLEKVENQAEKGGFPYNIKMNEYWVWIVTWGLIIILIIVLILIIYIIYKKFVLVNFLKQEEEEPSKGSLKKMKKQDFEKRIKHIEEELGEEDRTEA